MSGGSFNYLCYAHDAEEIMGRVDELDGMREYLIKNGYEDVAKDVQRLIEYIKSSRIVIETLADMLSDVFHAVEWYESGDYGKDTMENELEKYRKRELSDMVKTTDECVNCGLPCLGESCQNRNVRHLVCDKCGDESDRLYILDGEELCEDCLLEQFETIE